MTLSELDALRWMERLIGIAVALSSLELLAGRAALRDDAVFSWPLLRREYETSARGVRLLLDALLAYRPFLGLLGIQLAAALSLLYASVPLSALLLCATTALIALRFRGSYNGGSDYMTSIVLLAIAVGRLGPPPLAGRLALGYAAAQLTLSYFVAGLAKLQSASWRQGSALAQLVSAPQYAAPARLPALLAASPRTARVLAWAVLGFELSFPLALLDRRACLALLALAACFHLGNARVLGLHRFLWAWVSAFPALWFWAQRAP